MIRKIMKRLAVLASAVLLFGTAQAETLTLSGTVEAGETIPVYAPIGGTVETVPVEAGMRVNAGDILFTFRTEKTYASQDGTVAGLFAEPGDDAETVTERYGADLYLEGTNKYTVSASTGKAYSSVETTFIHTGETVYLLCRTDAKRYGTGIVTAVDGTSYTVLVTEGDFIAGDSVNIYRDADHTDKLRLGRGSVSRVSPLAVNAAGAVVSVAVKEGDTVKKGDLLMETLTGTFDAYRMSGTSVTAEETGIITSVTAEAGASMAKGDIALRIVPLEGMRVEASVGEDDRTLLSAGDRVTIALESDSQKTYDGTVRYISDIPEEGTDEVTYKAVIDFTPDENVVIGMKVEVTAGDQKNQAEQGGGT